MSLNGIDIASYQASLNPAAMATTDFIIIKVSQGSRYMNPTWRPQADGTLRAGKLLGLYHYVSGSGAAGEAAHFAQLARPYVGRAVLALDWESVQNRAWGNLTYLSDLAREVIRLTGVRPIIYASASVYGAVAPVARHLNCGIWVAQYASMRVTGYQGRPWNEGRYPCAMRQYTSEGIIRGYGGRLDLDKFYGDREAWNAYAKSSAKALPPAPHPDEPDINQIAQDVLAGKYGNGNTRRTRLGRLYDRVMAVVNARLRSKPTPLRVARPQVRVDGYVGRDTIRLWQQRMGTPVDGVISGQVVPRGYTRLALTSYRYGRGGSSLVRAVQHALNRQFPKARLTEDGLLGPRTILYLHAHEGVQVQSMRPWTNFGRGLGAAIQRSLNAGRW